MLEKHQKKIFAAVCAFMLFTGCSHYAPTCVKDGRRFCSSGGVFTHQWYDYYERALSCMEGGCYQDALGDLDNAIGARPDDKRMAKTYGIGHLRDYFPHREKGLIYYLIGDYDLAKAELELSIRYEKSAKALFYLDKVRKSLLEKDAKTVSCPQIHLNNTEIWTREVPVMISGVAEDSQYVSEILLGNLPVFLEGSDTRIGFEESLFLDEGRHDIVISARNLMNGSSAYPLTVYVDRTGPIIALESIEADKVQGYVYDESGEIFLNANGKKIDIPKGKEAAFSVSLDPDTGKIALIAKDKLGNESKAIADIAKLAQGQSRMFAEIVSDISRTFVKTESPEIIIDEPPDGKIVFSEILSVRGQIRSSAGIETVFINDTSLYEKHGRLISFNYPVSLNLGENRIAIRARNSAGKESVRTLIVIRETPEPLKLRYRCTFRTEPFRFYTPDDPTDIAPKFQYLLTQGLLARHRFQIAEPSEKQQTSGRFLLSGYFHHTKNGLEIAARITEIQTGELLYTLDAYGESGRPSETVISDLVEKFHRVFPLVRGRITQKNGAKMLVSADGDINMKWRLIVGSDTRFAGNAGIEEKMTRGHYRIKFTEHGDSAVGDWVVTE